MRKDLENYLYSLASQVDKMNKMLEKVNKELLDGKITPEQYESLKTQVDIISGNYQRVLYCKYLLDLRPKFIQKFFDRKQKKLVEKLIAANADKASVEKENDEALKKVGDILDGSTNK